MAIRVHEVFIEDHSEDDVHADFSYYRVHLMGMLHVIRNWFGIDERLHQNCLAYVPFFHLRKYHLLLELPEFIRELHEVVALFHKVCLFMQNFFEFVDGRRKLKFAQVWKFSDQIRSPKKDRQVLIDHFLHTRVPGFHYKVLPTDAGFVDLADTSRGDGYLLELVEDLGQLLVKRLLK